MKALIKHCADCGESHVRIAKTHEALASIYSRAASDAEKAACGSRQHYEDLANCHASLQDEHGNLAGHFVDLAKSLNSRGDDGTDDVSVSTEGRRGSGGDLDGPSKKAAIANHWGARLDGVVPAGLSVVGVTGSRLILRTGMAAPSDADPTELVDALKVNR